uniref:Modifier of mdg4 n=2 Tax=Drosophila melanogaster TaxID=7227 RepID=MMD4_DROME|nr:modifier of mdg4, isoform T [Drosophila melanogaster]Q86B87.1 RecName: Full=Modifier of mdg4 [Drosophila melanogaster]AAO41580.1 modifier of mdg4, isoform T [Drosophila melanogaster]|eukprot:NP_788698.1 modifier of mdg4, isoform T [Drosophila melanogaster]
MADDEQFSLCWNNFNTNLSAGFHESLCRGDLVDVSLAAEGQIVKAHRLVLSVCSPFFRKMFTQMPSNTHAIVFLNNVSHSALKDLIQFMYCGEVNVKQDALPAFISTAESLQIKGLTDNDPAPQPPQESSPPPAAPHVQQQQIPAQRVQRQQPRASARYKIETVDDGLGDEKQSTTQIVIQTTAAPQATIVQQQQPQQAAQQIQSQQLQTGTTTTATLVSTNKRSAQRSSLTPASSSAGVKRSKTSTSANVMDPLDSTTETGATTTAQLVPQQITVQTSVVSAAEAKLHQQSPQQVRQEEAEYIDLPMELPTKSEPDYSEDHGDAAGDAEGTYVEDDTYGDMRYDDSYFTENEDAGNQTAANTSGGGVTATTSKAVVKQQSQNYSESSFVDTSGDQGNTEAQAATSASATKIPPRKRGRPKTKVEDQTPKPKLLEKLQAATLNEEASEPAVYASTTKGGVKLIFNGHLFKFSFRKADYSVFQCCYREHGEECKVRVVCDQKRVFPYEGEHVHFMQASDKSCLPSQFMPGESGVISSLSPSKELLMKNTTKLEEADDKEDEDFEEFEIQEIDEIELDEPEKTPAKEEEVDPNDFREKIKRRLQKALQNKKK